MPVYCVWPSEDVEGAGWWVLASSQLEARRLVALNIEPASKAKDTSEFDCEADSAKDPPDGIIYSALNGTVTITRRS